MCSVGNEERLSFALPLASRSWPCWPRLLLMFIDSHSAVRSPSVILWPRQSPPRVSLAVSAGQHLGSLQSNTPAVHNARIE